MSDKEIEENNEEMTVPEPIEVEDIDDDMEGTMMVNSESEPKDEEPMAVPIPVHQAPDGCKEDHQNFKKNTEDSVDKT